jgi:polysaccharide deacetylase family protein (PEP-CTERM system associated)
MTGPAKAVSPDPIVNAMSVDVEDYFHVSLMAPVLPRTAWEGMERRVEGSTERLLALFDRAGVRATFFVLGWVAERHPGLVRRIAALGHEVASHGYGHELVYDLSPARFRDDVRRTRALLEDLSGTAVDGYRAPGFSVTSRSLWALDILIEEGYRYDASIFPIIHDRYGIPEAPRHPHVLPRPAGPVFEVPASTVRIGGVNLPVAGGGYFRLLPYAWTRWGIRRVNRRERKPVVFYLHPWELDPGQPRLPLRGFSAYRHYHNLARTEQRLGRLLREFRFARVRDVWQHELAGVPGLGRLEVPSPCAG